MTSTAVPTNGELIIEFILFIFKSLLMVAQSVFRIFMPATEKSVKNEIVLITGASRGIGKELAIQYAALGATVVCWGISREETQATVDEISRLGYPKAYFYECDVTDHKLVMETAKKVQKDVGDVTILINNAGLIYPKRFCKNSFTDVDHTLNVNLKSNFWTISAFLPTMLKNNHGHIVANCSCGGLTGVINGAVYSASKFAMRGMMEALYRELRQNPTCKVKLTTIYPFLTNTTIVKDATYRLPRLIPTFDTAYVAKVMISAQRRNIVELSIPNYFFGVTAFFSMFPTEVSTRAYEFLGFKVLK